MAVACGARMIPGSLWLKWRGSCARTRRTRGARVCVYGGACGVGERARANAAAQLGRKKLRRCVVTSEGTIRIRCVGSGRACGACGTRELAGCPPPARYLPVDQRARLVVGRYGVGTPARVAGGPRTACAPVLRGHVLSRQEVRWRAKERRGGGVSRVWRGRGPPDQRSTPRATTRRSAEIGPESR
eukprot:2958998-Prymnesium_polylepis.2